MRTLAITLIGLIGLTPSVAEAGSAGSAFDTVADSSIWMRAVAIVVGIVVTMGVRRVVDARFDLPDEAYGVLVAFVAGYLPDYQAQARLGGGLYAADKAAERFDLKQRVSQVGA